MKEENKEGNVNQQSFKCPFCPCVFCTDSDLQKHMDYFGTSEAKHIELFRKAHGRLEHASFGGQEE